MNILRVKKVIGLLVAIIVLSVFALYKTGNTYAVGQTFIVDSTNDDGDAIPGDGLCASPLAECTLRAAIMEANSNSNPSDQDLITFNIGPLDGSVKTIEQSVDYGNDSTMFVTQNVKIDGYSQDVATANSAQFPSAFNGDLLIELNGNSAHEYATSIRFSAGSDGSEVTGIVFSQFPSVSVEVAEGVSDISFQGNYVNTTTSGGGTNIKLPSNSGDQNCAIVSSGDNTIVGGSNPEDRNIIAGYNCGLTLLSTASSTIVKGNNFMVGADGVTPLQAQLSIINLNGADGVSIGGSGQYDGNLIQNSATGKGIDVFQQADDLVISGNQILGNQGGGISAVDSTNLLIGGSTQYERNIIADNDSNGIFIDNLSVGNIHNNYIGVALDGSTPLANELAGIYVTESTEVSVGSTSADDSNIIANNGTDGVGVAGSSSQVSILRNSLYDNDNLGIDLQDDGVTVNDQLDADAGPNNLLNAPKLLPPVVSGADTDVSYRLDVPSGPYRVEFFSNTTYDSTGFGEGETLIGSDVVTSDGLGSQLFNVTISGNTHTNISATLTEVDGDTDSGYGATSEFSGPPSLDIDTEITKSVVDLDTIAESGTIEFEVTYTNEGLDPIDVSDFVVDPGDPLNTALFNDIFPSNLILDSVSGDIDCSEQNSALSFDPLFSSHEDYTVASCSFTGASPTILNTDDSLTFTLTFLHTDPNVTEYSNFALAVPPTGDPDYFAYTNAVNGEGNLIGNFGTENGNLVEAGVNKPEVDLSLTKTLDNPEDVAPGANLQYTLTMTNNGPNTLDLTEFNAPFLSPGLITDYLHPDLTPSNLGAEGPVPGSYFLNTDNPNLTCLWVGPGSAGVFLGFTTHSNYSLVYCWATAGPTYLEDGGTIATTIPFDVANDSELDFTNYAVAPIPSRSSDPDLEAVEEIVNSDDELLDGIIASLTAINNFAAAPLPSDVGIVASLVNPEDVASGNTITYNVTLTNRGVGAINFANFSGAPNAILGGLFDGDSLQLIGADNPGITCADVGYNSASFLGPATEDHEGYNMWACIDDGSGVVLTPNESYTFELQFMVLPGHSNSFNLYAYTGVGFLNRDPDLMDIMIEITGATGDIMDSIVNDNYARVAYVGSGATEEVIDNTLSDTGQNRRILALIAGLVVLVGVTTASRMLYVRRKNSIR